MTSSRAYPYLHPYAITNQCMLSSVPGGWTRRVHPLGYVYYHKTCQGRVYITWAELANPYVRNDVHELINEVERLISLRSDVPSDHILVFLEPQYSGGSDCTYFLVNNAPESRCIFFLHDVNVTEDPNVMSLDGPPELGACSHGAIAPVSLMTARRKLDDWAVLELCVVVSSLCRVKQNPFGRAI